MVIKSMPCIVCTKETIHRLQKGTHHDEKSMCLCCMQDAKESLEDLFRKEGKDITDAEINDRSKSYDDLDCEMHIKYVKISQKQY